MNTLKERIEAAANPDAVPGLSRFFKSAPGEYGEGDLFLGIKVPVTRAIVKELKGKVGFTEIEECIRSPYHEMRLAALLMLVEIFKKGDRQKSVEFYLSHTDWINNWDLVDLSCYEILGKWLLDRNREILYMLAKEGKTIWERRIGIVSTMAFIRKGELDDTYAIVDIFAREKNLHDLLQKAAGWLLREAGKRDMERLCKWLESRHSTMPRTMLRYAIEKMDSETRSRFLKKPNPASLRGLANH